MKLTLEAGLTCLLASGKLWDGTAHGLLEREPHNRGSQSLTHLTPVGFMGLCRLSIPLTPASQAKWNDPDF